MHQTSRWSIAEDWFHSGKPGWFADPRYVPGGAFIDEGIYWIDLFEWLTGSEIVQVQGGTLCTKGVWRARDGSASGTTPFRVFIKDGVTRRSP